MKAIIENYINGNLTEAKAGAKRVSWHRLLHYLKDELGYSVESAVAISAYLKGHGSFQAACDAEARNKA